MEFNMYSILYGSIRLNLLEVAFSIEDDNKWLSSCDFCTH